MQSLRDELELRRKTEVHEIEEVSTSMTVYICHTCMTYCLGFIPAQEQPD